eukprot:TRINITY_DN52746_c0_g1_i1.p1 TRINITY_DN52746_c0_g1~~TRINITY_DN52746_c0_g1_i1.p1  ORF type:complete len:257 (+),score=47.18 TRINITY_DN52746_c0_g1_i1:17-787(+)
MPLVSPAKRMPYTVEEVEKHKTATDLWVIMNRKVYDLTAWAKRHPGGPGVILQMGGKDATSAAAAAHHKSVLPANLMWEFCVGYIVRVKPQQETASPEAGGDPDKVRKVGGKGAGRLASDGESEVGDDASTASDADAPKGARRDSQKIAEPKQKRRSCAAFLDDQEEINSRELVPVKKQASHHEVGDSHKDNDSAFQGLSNEGDVEIKAYEDVETGGRGDSVPEGSGLFCFMRRFCWGGAGPASCTTGKPPTFYTG